MTIRLMTYFSLLTVEPIQNDPGHETAEVIL